MKFPYAAYELDVPTATTASLHRPEVVIRVIGLSGEVTVDALLDTGADQVALPRSIAARVGAKLDEAEPCPVEGFAGQTAEAMTGTVTIEISDGPEVYRWPAEVCFVQYGATDQNDVVLLGHLGFLDYFDTEFLGKEKQVVLKPNGTFPPYSAQADQGSDGSSA